MGKEDVTYVCVYMFVCVCVYIYTHTHTNIYIHIYIYICIYIIGFPGGSNHKESACNVGDPGSIPESRRSPGEGNGYLLLYCCLENSMDRGTWETAVHGVSKSRT